MNAQPDFAWIIENNHTGETLNGKFYIYHGAEFHYFPDHGAAKTWCDKTGLQYRTIWVKGEQP